MSLRPVVTGSTPQAAPNRAASAFGHGSARALDCTLKDIRAEAERQREAFGNEPAARTLEWAADQVESAVQRDGSEVLTLAEASVRSGYSEEHLARMVRTGRIPDLRPEGSRARIRIRVADLPIKPDHGHIPDADAHELASRLFGGKEGRNGHP